MAKTLFFDLDGALTNPNAGITASIQYTMNKLGIAVGITGGNYGDFRNWITRRDELVLECVLFAVTH